MLYAEDFDLVEERTVRAPGSMATSTPGPDPESRPGPEPVVLEPTFSLVDLQRATAQALQEGRTLERAAVAEDLEARTTEALCRIAAALREAASDNARIAAAEAATVSRAVLAAVAAILPRLAAAGALAETGALLALLLPAMESQPGLQIRVDPAMIEPLRNQFSTMPVASLVPCEWVPVASMAPGDAIVKWQDGMMVRDTGALCAEVAALLLGAAADPGHEEGLTT